MSVSILGIQPSFGFGDRLGLGTKGHCTALQRFGPGISGIFAQQSIREMNRCRRSPGEVFSDAETALGQISYDLPHGADADHLKLTADVDLVFDSGFTFFTLDPSDHVNDQADCYSEIEISNAWKELQGKCHWVDDYLDQKVTLDTGEIIHFTQTELHRCAVKYGPAMVHSLKIAKYLVTKAEAAGRQIEIELSIDETVQPTTPLEHFVFADQLLKAEMPLVSVAPRFVGHFEKGIDFFGNRSEFLKTLRSHAAISRQLGPYKLSLHSGSDKLSIYEAFAHETAGLFHVKTAGTSYLEALRVVAVTDTPFFREIIEFSRACFEKDRATYEISSGLEEVLPEARFPDDNRVTEAYLNENAGRQILHVTFGSVLNSGLNGRFQEILEDQQNLYTEFLVEHFRKHLQPLTKGMAGLS